MNFKHILFAVDFSEHSQALNKQVEWLAERFRSRVTLLHVFEIPASWYIGSEASFVSNDCLQDLVDCAKRQLDSYSLAVPESRIERVFTEGDAAACITDRARTDKADLIVMGTHGHGKLTGLILGSVVAKVMHDVDCPVWTYRALQVRPQKPNISNMVCAVELTDEAVWLLQKTKELADEFGAKVQLVHSVPESETRPSRYFDFDLHRYLMDCSRIEIAKLQSQAGTQFPVTMSGELISKAIADVVLEHEADLAIIGRGKIQGALGRLRTHTFDIIRDSPCPVLSYSATGKYSPSYESSEELTHCVQEPNLN